MKIAVPYENGLVFQHFGHTASFKVYEVEGKEVTGSGIVSALDSGHGALAGLLKQEGISALLCGGIGEGAKTALSEAGIALYAGVTGDADGAVEKFLAGELAYDPNAKCASHDHSHGQGHSCGSHACGEDKHGCSGNHQ